MQNGSDAHGHRRMGMRRVLIFAGVVPARSRETAPTSDSSSTEEEAVGSDEHAASESPAARLAPTGPRRRRDAVAAH